MITKDDIEKAFTEKVEYRICPWRSETALRAPNLAEIKSRLISKLEEFEPSSSREAAE